MRLRNITGCREMIGESEFVVHEPETMKGKWREAFGNDHPVYVEIGMGKVAQPLRVAITGTQVSPDISHTVYLAGRDEALKRIDAALIKSGTAA